MEFVDIKIHKIAETKIDRDSIRQWLDGLGAQEYSIQDDNSISDPEHLVGLAAKRCYKSYLPNLNPNVTKVRSEWKSYFENILKSGHGSVLEHANFTYAFENVSRIFTAEMNRHRAGTAISEQSLRYVRFNSIPFWIPLSLRSDGISNDGKLTGEEPVLSSLSEIEIKKIKTRNKLKNVLEYIEKCYTDLVELWDFENMKDFHTKKVITSMLRRILPMGIATGAVYTLNGRAIRHICTMRCDPAAEEEICYVFSHIAKEMCSDTPFLFQDFKQTEEGFWYPINKKV